MAILVENPAAVKDRGELYSPTYLITILTKVLLHFVQTLLPIRTNIIQKYYFLSTNKVLN